LTIVLVKYLDKMPPKKKFKSGRSKKRRFAGNRYTIQQRKRTMKLQSSENRPKKPKSLTSKKPRGP